MREYGDTSDEFKLLKRETSQAYDNHFEYRFLSALRNYAQHCGLPQGLAEMNATIGQPNSLFSYFVRDDLLKYDGWKKELRKELEAQPVKFSVLPIIKTVFNLLKEINTKLSNRLALNYKMDAIILLKLIEKTQNVGGLPCLVKSFTVGDTSQYSLKWFPLKHISEITGLKIDFVHTDAKQE